MTLVSDPEDVAVINRSPKQWLGGRCKTVEKECARECHVFFGFASDWLWISRKIIGREQSGTKYLEFLTLD